jgi:hypothetical protein
MVKKQEETAAPAPAIQGQDGPPAISLDVAVHEMKKQEETAAPVPAIQGQDGPPAISLDVAVHEMKMLMGVNIDLRARIEALVATVADLEAERARQHETIKGLHKRLTVAPATPAAEPKVLMASNVKKYGE